MKIDIQKLTEDEIVNELASSSSGTEPNIGIKTWLRSEHSPIRGLFLKIKFHQIPTFVSVHLARHKIGIEHIVESNRPDLQKKYNKGEIEADRNTPVNHTMVANAQGIINLSKKRLCTKSHARTIKTLNALRNEMKTAFPELSEFMVPDCIYRNGICPEIQACGYLHSPAFKRDMDSYLKNFPKANITNTLTYDRS